MGNTHYFGAIRKSISGYTTANINCGIILVVTLHITYTNS